LKRLSAITMVKSLIYRMKSPLAARCQEDLQEGFKRPVIPIRRQFGGVTGRTGGPGTLAKPEIKKPVKDSGQRYGIPAAIN
jgi:hypothetical protein